MQYKTKIESTSTEITETYVVGNKNYDAELTIHNIGVYAGMAGWAKHTVSVRFVSEIEGSFTLQFPKVQRTDTTYPQRMLKPDESQFTSYAEQELIKAVKNFVSIKETFGSQHVLFDHVSMRIMEDTNSLTHQEA
ncbi:MAG: hypothetical protein WC194_10785 [Mesotoga sp.]|uniref:hypothetical protein n=1 Tax=Mesotoga sp. TaxID=2053577 RepID=UPI003564DF60